MYTYSDKTVVVDTFAGEFSSGIISMRVDESDCSLEI